MNTLNVSQNLAMDVYGACFKLAIQSKPNPTILKHFVFFVCLFVFVDVFWFVL